MTLHDMMRNRWIFWIALALLLPFTAGAGPEDYRFPRDPETTKDGYPLPLTGRPITKTPVVAKPNDVTLKKYPAHYIPGQETLADDEMRITIIGSGVPAPIRREQAAAGILVSLGNGDHFIFDIGGDTAGKLYSMGIHPSQFDKLFLTHLHLDHSAGILALFDAMGWARNTPLHVWGSSSGTPDLGVKAFTENIRRAADWHVMSKRVKLPVGGSKIVAHEFDYSKFSADKPNQLVYDNDNVKVYAFPVMHSLKGAVGYRLEWNSLTMVYTGDSEPTYLEAEQSKGADVFIHEVFPSIEAFAASTKMSLEHAGKVVSTHTSPAELGVVFGIAKPRLGVGSHFSLGDDLIDDAFRNWRTTYDGPLLLAQDLTTINVTTEQIVSRQASTDLLASPPEAPPQEGVDMSLGDPYPSELALPTWLTKTRIRIE